MMKLTLLLLASVLGLSQAQETASLTSVSVTSLGGRVTPSPTLAPTSKCGQCTPGTELVVSEDFESYNRDSSLLSNWHNVKLTDAPLMNTTFLGPVTEARLPGSRYNDSRVIYTVPSCADYLFVSFDFYEFDNWQGLDCFYVHINGERLDLNFFNADEDEGYKTGWTENGITWTMDSSNPRQLWNDTTLDQTHHVIAKVPNFLYKTYGEIKMRFVTQVNDDSTETSGVDNIKIEAVYECGICEDNRVIADEDFEDGTYDGWWKGKIDNSDKDAVLTSFLGKYDKDDFEPNDPTKVYIVDRLSTMITIDFDFYELDEWEMNDCLYVYINGIEIFLGIFNMLVDEGYRKGAVKAGKKKKKREPIEWEIESFDSPTMLGGSSDFVDQIHHVTLHIPNWVFMKDGLLEVSIATRIDDVADNESAGFDNIKLIAYYKCDERVTEFPTISPAPTFPKVPTLSPHPTQFSPAFTPTSPEITPLVPSANSPSTPAYTPAYTPAMTPNYEPVDPSLKMCTDKPDTVTFYVSLEFPAQNCSWLNSRPDWQAQICTKRFSAWTYCPVTCGRFSD